jgi:integrase
MPRRRDPVSKYLRHSSGQARVVLRDPAGRRRDYLLGPYGSPESRAEYERVLALLRAGHTPWTDSPDPTPDLTVAEVLLRYKRHAEVYYPNAKVLENILLALRPARVLFSHLPAAEFSPLKLKAVRTEMIRSGLSRPVINQRIGVLKRVFRWAVAEELVVPAVYQALQTVTGLAKGRTPAREPEPIRPVPDACVDATLTHAPPPVRSMIQLQRLTGMRPGEVCIMRACDLDMTGDVWVYRPRHHKTQHHDKERVVHLGPRAQAVITPFLTLSTEAYLFSPARAEAEREADRRRRRVTPLYPSHLARYARQRTAAPKRPAGDRYTTHSYNQAVARACAKADRLARQEAEKAQAALKGREPVDVPARVEAADRLVPHWHPHQLRHSHLTGIRRRYGLEAAQVMAGHSQVRVTELYAETDGELARRVAREVG